MKTDIVAAIIRDKKGRFLTIKSKKFKDWLFFPGGKVDPEDKDSLSALIRELEEELEPIGLKFTDDEPISGTVDVPVAKGSPHSGNTVTVICYYATLRKFTNVEKNKHESITYMSANAIRKYYKKTDKIAETIKLILGTIYGEMFLQ